MAKRLLNTAATITAATMLLLSFAARHVGVTTSVLRKVPAFLMSEDERAHVLTEFNAAAPPTASNATDTVWARRVYAPMYVHSAALTGYREQIAAAFPEHEVAFDVCFAAASTAVPWHTDHDSLPFETSFASVVRGDFVTVHANIVSPADGKGRLRTIDDSLAVAAVHFVANRLLNNFGSLAAITEPLATALGARIREHDGTPGVGNAFNNLKAHDVTQGAGRISYVVRLVRKSVHVDREKLHAAARGERSTRRIREFERLLPLFVGSTMAVGDFPWAQVPREIIDST